ncbi:MAG: isoprenylcysteine carboxylmethyltransferase family protein [Chloroflexi bacterium]|nr:isoprenylcysteine carboxylmethyltransferase family protein [Chloroflexota bacterium]
MLVFRIALFAALSAGIVLISLPSLRRPGSHGFYRFFAFEALVGLLALNLDSWFRDVLSPRQIVSWIVLLASLVFAVSGFYSLRTRGKAEGNFENTTVLVTHGIYKYIRHPLYSSLGLLGWGIFVKAPSVPGLVLAHLVMFSVFAAARVEEAKNLKKFGAAYEAFVKKTRKFIPFLY